MSQGFFHGHVLVPSLERVCLSRGADVRREHPVRVDGHIRFVDLYIRYRGWRIACEVENCANRVRHDIAKASALQATLLIVTPDGTTARAIRRKMRTLKKPKELQIWILSYCPALQRLGEIMI